LPVKSEVQFDTFGQIIKIIIIKKKQWKNTYEESEWISE
jgi:hypothetical protein